MKRPQVQDIAEAIARVTMDNIRPVLGHLRRMKFEPKKEERIRSISLLFFKEAVYCDKRLI